MGRKQTAGRHATNGTRRIRARRALTVAITALVTLGCCGAYVWADIADKAPGILTNAAVQPHIAEPQGASAHSRCPFHCQCRHLACHRCRGGGEAHRRTPREERGGADVSAIIMQADGTVVADHAADVAREPASTMKTLTSLAAASVLDMGDTLPTQTFLLQAEQGTDTVVIKGNGDMLLGAGDSDPDHVNGRAGLLTLAKNTAHALKQRGVTKVNLQYDDSLFGADRTPTGIEANNPDSLYYTPVSSMAIDGGRQWNGANPRNPDVFESYPALSQNTAADVTAIFRNLLGAQGITIVNAEPTQTTVSADRTPIAEVESAPLAMVMAFMLRHSDNTLAEEFGRLLALSTKQENSPAGATAAVRNELRTLGIDLTGLQMADCSGLTPGSRLTANTLAQVQARNLDVGGAVAAAEGLSIPGLVGTAANRLASTQAAGLTRVKTGSLQEVSSMTGNVSREQGGVAAFAVIVNNPEDFEATRTAINEFVAGLAAL
ncbi:MAG: D-alanyl-D-alanine carboxypeptidase [Bifidobacterium animalis]